MTTVHTSDKKIVSDKIQHANNDVLAKPRGREIVLPVDEMGFVKMPDDGLRYTPEECNAKPLEGYLVSAVRRVSPDNGVFYTLVIHTSQPTLAIDIEGNVVEVPIESRVEIVAVVKLRDYIRYAMHPSKCFEIRITPIKKKKLSGGRGMWMFDIALHPEGVKRPNFYPAPTREQLEGDEGGQTDSNVAPF